MYANDAKLFKVINSENDRAILQSCLNALILWCKKSDACLNGEKCVVMKNRKMLENGDFGYRIGLHVLNYCDKIKDLGVMFDQTMKFKDHIYDKINKSFSILGLINRNFKNASKDSFMLLYKTMVK